MCRSLKGRHGSVWCGSVGSLLQAPLSALNPVFGDLSNARQVELIWEDNAPGRVLTSLVLTGDDLKDCNTFESPLKVVPRNLEKPSISSAHTF